VLKQETSPQDARKRVHALTRKVAGKQREIEQRNSRT
jgi:hypothetical protein